MNLPDAILAKIADVEERESSGPNRMAAVCEVLIPHLLAERDAATDRAARRALNSRLKASRDLLKWAKTRAGYVRGA